MKLKTTFHLPMGLLRVSFGIASVFLREYSQILRKNGLIPEGIPKECAFKPLRERYKSVLMMTICVN